jgi:hypothetical protein
MIGMIDMILLNHKNQNNHSKITVQTFSRSSQRYTSFVVLGLPFLNTATVTARYEAVANAPNLSAVWAIASLRSQ